MGMMSQNILLAAKELGIHSVPAVNLVVYPDLIRNELDIPYKLSIILGIASGYAHSEEPINKHKGLRRPIGDALRVLEKK